MSDGNGGQKPAPTPAEPPAQPLPKIGVLFLVSCIVGAVVVVVFVGFITKNHDNRSTFFEWLGLSLLATSAIALIWSAVVTFVGMVDPRVQEKEKKEEKTTQVIAGTAAGTETSIESVVTESAELVKAISSAPRWLGIAVLGIVFLVMSMLLDGYRYADGGITTATAVVSVPTSMPAPTPTTTGG
jgi:hypothetical protein